MPVLVGRSVWSILETFRIETVRRRISAAVLLGLVGRSHVEKAQLHHAITGGPKRATIILVKALVALHVCLKPKIVRESKVKEYKTRRLRNIRTRENDVK